MSLKKFLLLPLIFSLFLMFSCVSKEDPKPSSDKPNPANNPTLNKVPPTFNITSFGKFTCARHNQKIKCWGENSGRFGAGTTDNKGSTQTEMDSIPYVDLGDNFEVIDVKSGKNYTCALSASGNVKCWGATRLGYLGTPSKNWIGSVSSDMGNNLIPIKLGDDFTVTKLFEGGNCAQIQSGDVKCWGYNGYGQLGIGSNKSKGFAVNTMGNNLPKVELGQTFDIKKIMTTEFNACALNQSGDMKCWGRLTGIPGRKADGNAYPNNVGDLAVEIGNHLKTMDLGSRFTVSDFDLQRQHVCALSTSGDVKCWGNNRSGQLGQDNTETFLGKTAANQLGDNLPPIRLGFTAKQIKIGDNHSCALSTEGKIKCWGNNSNGQLGYGDKKNRGKGETAYTMDDLDYVDLGDDFKITSIELGAYNSCAISPKYEVKCWGYSSEKQVLADATGGNTGDADNEMGNNLKIVKIFHDLSGDLSLF